MIFGFLVKALRAIVDGFASVCAFLLITLGLWLPAVYSLLFLIICAIAGVRLAGGVITFYIIGLVLTFLGGAALAAWRYNRKRPKKTGRVESRNNVRSVKKREYADFEKERSVREEEDFSYSSPPPREEPESYAEPQPYNQNTQSEQGAVNSAQEEPKQNIVSAAKEQLYGKPKSGYEDFSDLRKKYFGDEKANDNTPAQRYEDSYGDLNRFDERGDDYTVQADPLLKERLERRLMGCETQEKPMIFAMRSDPDIIVYEYSDRLKYYRKTRRGLIHISTEFKK